MGGFEAWLSSKLTELGTDESVFSPYISRSLISSSTFYFSMLLNYCVLKFDFSKFTK